MTRGVLVNVPAAAAAFLVVRRTTGDRTVAGRRGRSVSVDHPRCAGTPVLLFMPWRSRGDQGVVSSAATRRFSRLGWFPSCWIAGTVIAAIENLRPGVTDPHRPHRDGGSPDTDRPLDGASGVACAPTCERAVAPRSRKLLGARRSRRVRAHVIRADGMPRGPCARATVLRRSPYATR